MVSPSLRTQSSTQKTITHKKMVKKFLIVGLGNYNMEQTRHSVGYMLANHLTQLPSSTQFRLNKSFHTPHQSNNHLINLAASVDDVNLSDWIMDKHMNSQHSFASFNLTLPLGKKPKVSPKASKVVPSTEDPTEDDMDPAQQPDGIPVSPQIQPTPKSDKLYKSEKSEKEDIGRKRETVKNYAVHQVELHFVKPYSFMNTSGPCVNKAIKRLNIPIGNLIVLHDELDEALGAIKWKWGGSTNGHNGLKSVAASIGTPNFIRCRIGIGRPKGNSDVTSWVLQNFKVAEKQELYDTAFPKAFDGLLNIIAHQLSLPVSKATA
jgi:PTH1 family peptidyl-tRNA hydrolase